MEDLERKTPEYGSSSEGSSSDSGDNKDTKSGAKQETKSSSRQDDAEERSSWFDNDKDKASEKQSLYDLFEQHADPEPPIEELATDEQALVVDEQTELNLDAANAELVGTEPGTPEEAAAIAGATFNEAVRERIDNGEEPTTEMLDGAMDDTADIMGLDSAEVDDEEPELPIENAVEGEDDETDSESPVIADEEVSENEASPPPSPESDESVLEDAEDTELPADTPEAEAPPETEPPDPGDTPPTPPGTPPPGSPPGGPGAPGGPPGGGGGPGVPPIGPAGPGAGGPGFGGGGPPLNMNAMPAAANMANALGANPWLNPNVATGLAAGQAMRHNRHSHWPYVLAGGVVGYFIGRRRGRIKTEKKLLPVQRKLEGQVTDLQYQVALREAKIRKLAYEKAISHPHIHAALPKRLKELQELQKASLKKADFETMAQESDRTAKSEKVAPKAAEVAVATAVSAGLLGKVAAITERKQESPQQTSAAEHVSTQQEARKVGTETLPPAKDMQLPDLLAVAEQIPLEDRTLRYLYESGRMSQEGLRRVIEAYLRGERYDKLLYENLQTRTQDIESLPPVVEAIHGSDNNTLGKTTPHADTTEAHLPADLANDAQFTQARQEYFDQLSLGQDGDAHTSRKAAIAIAVVVTGMIIGLAVLIF